MSKTITFAFYDAVSSKADGKKMTMADRVILLRSQFIHAEIIFDFRGGVSFSSTLSDGATGCRFRYITYLHKNWWKFIKVRVSDDQEQAMWECACDMADVSYHWQAVFSYEKCLEYYFRDGNIRGVKNVKYDLLGLMTFALEKSGKLWLDCIRFGLWAWTACIKPDPDKVWCSKSCAIVWNACTMFGLNIKKTELDPGDLFLWAMNLPDNLIVKGE